LQLDEPKRDVVSSSDTTDWWCFEHPWRRVAAVVVRVRYGDVNFDTTVRLFDAAGELLQVAPPDPRQPESQLIHMSRLEPTQSGPFVRPAR
jgi:hypothetical protein